MAEPVFFLTAENPRDIPRGSRDPLRFVQEWGGIGRALIPYLTTVTPSYRGFLTRFLFHGILEKLAPEHAQSSKDKQWEQFCKFEQLCAIVRVRIAGENDSIPGITGVFDGIHYRSQKGSSPVATAATDEFTVGGAPQYWLKRSQKGTGLWGYYHQAALRSGLLQWNRAEKPGYLLSDKAKKVFDQQTCEVIKSLKEPLADLFKKPAVTLKLSDFSALATCFTQKPDPHTVGQTFWSQNFWFQTLLAPPAHLKGSGADTTQFAIAVRQILTVNPSMAPGQVWETLATGKAYGESVVWHAKNVCAAEAVMSVCQWVFDECRRDGRGEVRLWDVAARLCADDGFKQRIATMQLQIQPSSTDLLQFRSKIEQASQASAPDGALTDQRIRRMCDLIDSILQRHVNVMQSRRSAPWVEVSGQYKDGQLVVRDASDALRGNQKEEAGIEWNHDYFLKAWISAAKELGYIPDDQTVGSHDAQTNDGADETVGAIATDQRGKHSQGNVAARGVATGSAGDLDRHLNASTGEG